MRAVIYARYSSDLQSAASIEDQIHLCQDRIAREGWAYLHAYTDRALSGASRLRPSYQKLLEDARAGKFDIVLAEALDRLSRDQEDVAALYKHLTFAGVTLITLAEGEINELHVGLKGTMNALFLKDLAAKTRRGMRGRVEKGLSGGGLCYGYDVVRALSADGEPVRGKRAISPAEADIVRRIFAAFAVGQSPRAIAKRLNAAGVPGPGGRPWIDTTIRGNHRRGTGILRNELYIGRLVWNRLKYVKDPKTGKRLSRLNPPETWIIESVPHLRIVDQDLWERVQARLGTIRESPMVTKLRATRFWEKRRAKHLLTGRAVCGVCDKLMAAVGRDYLACNHARRNGACTNRRGMRRAVLENLILDALKRELMHPELVKEFIAAFHAEVNRLQGDRERQHAQTCRDLAEISRKIDHLVEAIADGLRAPGLQRKLDELEARKAAIEKMLSDPPPPVRLHTNLAELYRQKVARLREALSDPTTRDEALEIIRSLIERVVLHPIDNGFEIELVGALAAMVAVANEAEPQRKKAVPEGTALDAYRRSIKVVAGAGFEPTTFRL